MDLNIFIIILSVLIFFVVIIILIKLLMDRKDDKDTIERLGRFELNINKELQSFKTDLNENLSADFDKLNEKLEKRLLLINDKVNERIEQNFEKTNKTFNNVIERLSRIDEAQKKIEHLSSDIVSLQSVLTDKKSRGIFGEVNLKHVLTSVFGEKNDKIYQMQVSLSNGTIVDSLLYAPEPLGTIAIDSKFPLENYQLMVDKKISAEERARYEKLFKIDVKKHIDAISSKYIIPRETSDQAIMFLPAEAIFAELNAYHQDIIEYAYKKRVWISSPTTLISTLTVIQMILKNIERDKYTSIIHDELNKLGVEFSRYKDRWNHLAKAIQTVNKDVENIHISSEKISKKFESISKVELDLDQKNRLE